MPRVFIAVDVDQTVKHQLSGIQEQLSATGAHLKLVETPNIHVTMKFLGDTPDTKIPALIEALRKAASEANNFDIEVKGIGVFPSLKHMRVIWAGIAEGREGVKSLQHAVDKELEPLGFRSEKDFIPHMTIARVKSAKEKDKLAEIIQTSENLDFGQSRVTAIELKESKLTPKGPIYSTIERVNLA